MIMTGYLIEKTNDKMEKELFLIVGSKKYNNNEEYTMLYNIITKTFFIDETDTLLNRAVIIGRSKEGGTAIEDLKKQGDLLWK